MRAGRHIHRELFRVSQVSTRDTSTDSQELLTTFWATNLSHCLGSTLDKNVTAFLTKMSRNDTRSPKLRYKLKGLQDT